MLPDYYADKFLLVETCVSLTRDTVYETIAIIIERNVEDDTVETVYTNDDEAGYLLRLMSSVENIEKFHSMSMKGLWDKALEELMIDDVVDKTHISTADKASLDQLAKSVGITLGP